MFLKWIKKHKLNFFSYLFCAFAMALFTIISFSCKTYAYSIDNNGNLVGDNLINPNFSYNDEGIICTTNKQTILINGTSTGNVFIDNSPSQITLNSGTYFFSIQNKENYNSNRILVFLQDSITSDRFYADIEQPFTINETKTYDITIRLQNTSTFENCKFNIMLNKGNEPLEWEPYGIWYNENNYNAVVEDNEELIDQINTRNTKELQSGIKANLQGTYLKVYNQQQMELTNMLATTPFYQEEITFTNDQLNYNMSLNNTEVFNAILNNNGEFMNGQQLTTDYPTLLYTFKTPLYIQALTFSRGDTSGTRYINIYFSDNSSTELLLAEGSENNRTDITWTNDTNKYVKYISTTAEVGYNLVETFTIPNSSQIYTSGYEQGYTDGWYESYQAVADNIQNTNQNLQAKYNQGYNEGYQKGADSTNSLYNMVIRS